MISFSVFQVNVESLADRQGLIGTYFLAAFAMLYVVGDALPKPDFLTKIDLIITVNTLLLAVACIAVSHIAHVAEKDGLDKAQKWNDTVLYVCLVVYILFNVVIFPGGECIHSTPAPRAPPLS